MRTHVALKVFSALYVSLVLVLIVQAGLGKLPALIYLYRSIPLGDKVGHVILMGGLAFSLSILMDGRRSSLFRGYVHWGSVVCALLVTVEEFSQMFLARRTFSLTDLASNYIGIALIGELLLRRVLRQGWMSFKDAAE